MHDANKHITAGLAAARFFTIVMTRAWQTSVRKQTRCWKSLLSGTPLSDQNWQKNTLMGRRILRIALPISSTPSRVLLGDPVKPRIQNQLMTTCTIGQSLLVALALISCSSSYAETSAIDNIPKQSTTRLSKVGIHSRKQSEVDSDLLGTIGTNPTDPEMEEQCGMSMRTPDLKRVDEQAIRFGCSGSYKSGGYTVINMDFQYDRNFELSGGARINFVVEGVGIEKKTAAEEDSVFRLKPGDNLPTLAPGSAYQESNCGDPVTKTDVTPIQGSNWHGWIAEETFAKARGSCRPAKEYTSRYRCVHVMVGNDKMTAQLDGVCLLRKRELSLENGFSYDLFMDLLKTLRFKEQ
ncbi:hypothetical protein [Paraburkholderia phytofirmans]|nr:hypothetical protein [Paraburkholderia phytofirmans]